MKTTWLARFPDGLEIFRVSRQDFSHAWSATDVHGVVFAVGFSSTLEFARKASHVAIASRPGSTRMIVETIVGDPRYPETLAQARPFRIAWFTGMAQGFVKANGQGRRDLRFSSLREAQVYAEKLESRDIGKVRYRVDPDE